jgi:tetratricopeptide (TPR) repeat protein/tRNA A-37 threonylcarbamoyl transferase component Bud32
MIDETGSDEVSLPLPALERIETACLEFEAAWKKGSNPPIEEYLGSAQGPERTELLRELLLLELDYRNHSDEHPTPDEYQARFPQDSQLVSDVFEKLSTDAAVAETSPFPSALPTAEQTLPCQFGDYELLEEIAHGGMGVVYKARQISLNRIVAVKMILRGQLAGEADVKRFHTEAEAAANLQHPGIVAIHEVGVHEGQHYFSMDYVEGQSLAALVRESPLPAKKAAAYVQTIAEAVHYAHEQGILHRDLKPSNVLIDANDQPRITDFGLAKRIEDDSDLTATGDILGTASYMSPEQASGRVKELNRTSDVYSLGAVLYELLTDQPPFRGPTVLDTLFMVRQTEPIAPRITAPHIPRDLETICLKCLEKEPARRYATAEELADELARYGQGLPIHARPITRLAHGWRWCRRNPVVAGLSVSLAAIILVVAVTAPIVAMHQVSLRQTAEGLVGRLQQSLTREQLATKTAQYERDRAGANHQKAVEAVDRLLQHFGEYRLQDIPYGDRLRQAVLQDAAELFGDLARQTGDDPATRAQVARAHGVLGAIHGDMGNDAEAETAYRQAAEGLEALVRDFPENPGHREILAANYLAMSRMLNSANRPAAAEEKLARGRELMERLREEHPGVLKYGCCLTGILCERARVLELLRRLPEAEAACEDAVRVADDVVARIPPETPPPDAERAWEEQVQAYTRWGTFLCSQNRYPEALEPLQKALEVFGKAAPELKQSPADRGTLFNIYLNLAPALFHAGQLQEALEISNRALLLRQRDAAEHPLIPKNQCDLGAAWSNHAVLLRALGKPGEACKTLARAISHQRRALDLQPQNPVSLMFMFNHVANLVETWLQWGDDQKAEQAISALAVTPRFFGPGLPSAIQALGHVAREVRADTSRPPERREQIARCCLETAEKLIDAGIANTERPDRYHGWARFLLDCPQVELRDPGRAVEMAEKAVQGDPNVGQYWQTLGAAHYHSGNWQEALKSLDEANQREPTEYCATWALLAMAHWQLGREKEARDWYSKLVARVKQTGRLNSEDHRYAREAAKLLGMEPWRDGEQRATGDEDPNHPLTDSPGLETNRFQKEEPAEPLP